MLNKKRRFVVSLTLLLAAGFILTSLVSYYVARDSMATQLAETTLPLTSDNIYSEIQKDLLRPIFIASLMAQDTFLRDWVLAGEEDPQQVIRYLKTIQQRYGTVTSFFVSERSHSYYHTTGVLKQVDEADPQDAWYFRARQLPQAEDFEINVDTDTANPNSTTIFVNYKVFDYHGELIGVTGVGLTVETVKELIESYQRRYNRHIFFIDREGEIKLYGSNFPHTLNIHQWEGVGKIATQILTQPSGAFTFSRNGKLGYLNTRLVPEFKWIIVVEQDEDPAQRELFNTLLLNLLACLAITAVVVVLANITIGGYQSELELLASTDKLTGAINRQVFEAHYMKTLKSAARREFDISVVMLDIDHFKQVNDEFGHLAGDEVLRRVTSLLQRSVRDSDTVCRWGGEEFMLLLPHCDSASAMALAEKIRSAITQITIVFGMGREVTVTASLGVAQYQRDDSPDSLLNRADKALYRAKQAGRNRVVGPSSDDNASAA